jgi:hypothetical protein
VFGARTRQHIEIQVNPEFRREEAEDHANRYAPAIGRMPGFLFEDLRTVWIHDSDAGWGGGNNNLLIHTDRSEEYIADQVLEEAFLHEGTHTSMDDDHAGHPAWRAAQRADGMALSRHAFNYLDSEDLAETLGPYLGIRFRAHRLG